MVGNLWTTLYETSQGSVSNVRNFLGFRTNFAELYMLLYQSHGTIGCLRNYFRLSAILTELSCGSVTRVRSLQQITELKKASVKTY